MLFHKVSNFHYWTESRTVTLASHDLTLNEQGCWECTCKGYFFERSCAHTTELVLQLYGPSPVVAARLAVKLAQAQGVSLVTLMDYSASHPVTNRARVTASPLHALPSRDREYSEPVLVCVNCGCSNSPEAQVCRVCSHRPGERYLVHTA